MYGNVEVHVRATNDVGDEVEGCVTVHARHDDLRLAAFASLQDAVPEMGKELGLSTKEQMRLMMARLGALSRDASEQL